VVDATTFRVDFPEFASATKFPDGLVTRWLTIAAKLVNGDRWGDLTDFGTELVAAHNLVLAARDTKSAAMGTPGQSSGVVASKAVDKVSVSYDAGMASVEGGGNWNLTTYGTRYLYYLDLFGAGGVQL
jgi:hypothetical protein